MGLLTPEEALAQYRAYDPETMSAERGDFLANEFFANYGVDQEYGRKGYEAGGLLSPQEQMQIEWLRANKGQNSGNNKDDRIKRIRQENDMDKELLVDGKGDQRYIIRNKIDKAGKADGMTSGDAYQIGDYTQSDTGKDDGMFQQAINKALPGFDVGDVTSLPYIDYVAAAAAPFTGGVSTAVLEGLKAAEAGEIDAGTIAAIVGAAGGWESVLGGLEDFIPEGAGAPEWLSDAIDYGKDAYDAVADSDVVQGIQDVYGDIRDFTDPIEDIFGSVTDVFGDFDMGSLDDFLPDMPEMTAPAATGGFAMSAREKLELLPLEYRQAYQGPVGLLNPFEAG